MYFHLLFEVTQVLKQYYQQHQPKTFLLFGYWFKEKSLRRKSEPVTSGAGVFLSSDQNAHFKRLESLLASQMALNDLNRRWQVKWLVTLVFETKSSQFVLNFCEKCHYLRRLQKTYYSH